MRGAVTVSVWKLHTSKAAFACVRNTWKAGRVLNQVSMERHMQNTGLVRALKAIVTVLLMNGVFYAYYRIAAIRLSSSLFAVGCVILVLVMVAICRKWGGSK